MHISEKHIEAHISNLRGRLNYETKKQQSAAFLHSTITSETN